MNSDLVNPTFDKPLVSVIIPTYNRGELLTSAVKSVLEQTYTNIECIVVDDCSTDHSIENLRVTLGYDNRLIIKTHEINLHASAARNTGIEIAKGNLIAFLDDDDIWLKEKLEKQVSLLLNSDNKVGLVYCWLEVFNGKKSVSTLCPELEGDVFEECLAKQPLGNASTILVRSEVIKKIGLFDINLPRGNDGDFIRRIAQHYKVRVVKEILVRYYVSHHGNPRISLNTYKGINNSVFSQETKLKKFNAELQKMPLQHQQILISIGRGYLSIGKFIPAFKAFLKAYKINSKNKDLYIAPFLAFKDALARLKMQFS